MLVMMNGPPGAGKSTLSKRLAASFGSRAFLFDEEMLFEVPEFAEVAKGFRSKSFPDESLMLEAYQTFIERVRNDVSVVICDWSCVGMIEDLPCAQPDRTSVTTHHPEMRADPGVLAGHARDVGSLADRSVLFVLDTPIANAIQRVYESRGEEWFDRWRGIVEVRDGETFLDGAVRYWEAGRPRGDDCTRGHTAGGWDVIRLDASRLADEVLEESLISLRYLES